MKNIKIYLIFTITMLTSFSSITLAKSYSGEELSAFAKRFLESSIPQPELGHIEISVSNLDPRININPCDVPLKANIPEKNYSRNVNVKVYCDGTSPWKIYIPAKINTMLPLVIAKQKISKGTTLSADNLIVTYQNINSIRGASINNISQVAGTKAKRHISKDKAISLKYICYVCKGESVTIIAESDNLHIKAAGIALENGSIGDTIKVKNVKSGNSVFAKVKNINQVIINL